MAKRDCNACDGTGRQPETNGQKSCGYCGGSGKQSAGSILRRKEWDPPEVSSKFGAPMGRGCTGDKSKVPLVVRKVKWADADDPYDAGGAYWGLPANVWVLLDVEKKPVAFTRAASLEDAEKGFKGMSDSERFTAQIKAELDKAKEVIRKGTYELMAPEDFEKYFWADIMYLATQEYRKTK